MDRKELVHVLKGLAIVALALFLIALDWSFIEWIVQVTGGE